MSFALLARDEQIPGGRATKREAMSETLYKRRNTFLESFARSFRGLPYLGPPKRLTPIWLSLDSRGNEMYAIVSSPSAYLLPGDMFGSSRWGDYG